MARSLGTALNLPVLLLSATPLAWLLPNHYHPWPTAWQDGIVLALLFGAAMAWRHKAAVDGFWALALSLALGALVLQLALGTILFAGDGLMVALYLAAFAVSLALGQAASGNGHGGLPDALAAGLLVGALASAAIALVQWTGAMNLGPWVAELPPGARPFGNVAQPNHLCTIALLGLCSGSVLRESGRLGAVGYWSTAVCLIGAMVMSGSRTGWLQLGLLLALTWALRKQLQLRSGHGTVAVLLAVFITLNLLWPLANEFLLLGHARRLGDAPLAGAGREVLWPALLDAVRQSPWLGYGWQQVVIAQQFVALDHPPVMRHFEHSHNLVLDFLLWVGVPMGGAIIAAGGWALWRQLRALRDARALWLVAGALGVLVHAMLEFPLEYAYFLVPVGLMLGAARALSPPGGGGIGLPRWSVPAAGILLMGLLVLVAIDYLKAEENHRMLRLETARVGVERLETPAAELLLLNQLQAFLAFARDEAKPGMGPDALERMRRVSLRFAYPPAMFRYALAAGLNGQPAEAELTLSRVCRVHPPPRCIEAIDGWRQVQLKYPQLVPIPAPSAPGR